MNEVQYPYESTPPSPVPSRSERQRRRSIWRRLANRSPRSGTVAALLAAGALLLWGAPAAAQEPTAEPVVVDTIIVTGLERQIEGVVVATSGLASGQRITYRDIQQALRRLWATGEFEDVKVFARPATEAEDGPVALVIEVVEQPIVSAIEFRGLERIRPRTVRDSAGLATGRPLRPSRVREAETLVESMLAEKGIQLKSLDTRLEEVPGTGERVLVFDVVEGPRIALAEVVFEGNEAFSDSRLRRVMGTRPEGFLWFRRGHYDEEKLREDLRERLPAFYGEHGYIDFAVRRDTLIVDPATGKGRLVVELDEGSQYRLAELDTRGNRRFATDDLTRFFEQEQAGLLSSLLGRGSRVDASAEPVFDHEAFQRATDRIAQLYRNEGYLFSQVHPVLERTRTGGGEPAVRAIWQIQEGDPAYVNRVNIAGNTYTHERVIRERLLVLPGDVYNEDLLIQSYHSITALGFFESPLPMPAIEPTDDGDVDITFHVQERQTGSINFGTTVGGGLGVAGFLGYDQPNLFGQAKSGHLRWEYGRWQNNFEVRYADPSLFQSRVSGSAALFSTRDRFFQFAEGQRRRTGTSLRFGLPLPTDPRWSRVNIGYSLSRTTYEQFDEDQTSGIFALPPGVQSTVSLGVARNRLNHPMFPTAGSRQEIEGSFSGGILGGHGDFQKYTASGAWWVPVASLGGDGAGPAPINMTIGLTADAGALFGDASRFPFERFWMGGVQFGRPLRGYEETTITPDGYFPRGDPRVTLEDRFGDAFLRLSAEYAIRFGSNVSLGAFYDAGNVWRSPSQINPTRLMRGAGVGVTLVTPFGPLGLDYAYGFDKDVPGWQLHFRFGHGF